MSEPLIITLLVCGPLLWMLGGYRWKWLRRIVWPVVIATSLMIVHQTWFVSLEVAGLTAIATSLPYGDKTPWLLRTAVFAIYGLPAVILNVHWWAAPILTAVILTGLFSATRKVNWITFKIFEAMAGFLQAATIVMAVLR